MIAPGGLVITPLLHARGDAILSNPTAATQATIAGSTIDGAAVPLVNNLNNTRTLALPRAWVENRHRTDQPTASAAERAQAQPHLSSGAPRC